MHVRIDTTWHDQLALRVDDFYIRMMQIFSDQGNFFFLNQNIPLKSFCCSNQGSVLNQSRHWSFPLHHMALESLLFPTMLSTLRVEYLHPVNLFYRVGGFLHALVTNAIVIVSHHRRSPGR